MKKLAILGTIFLGLNTFGQNIVLENIDHNLLLYRGFENKFTIGQTVGTNETFQMEAINCEVSKMDGYESTYIVKPKSKARTAQINFFSNGQFVDSATFIVRNLPSPSLFWGSQETGSSVSNSPEMHIKYPSEVTLKSNFEIISWKCNREGTDFKGLGNILTQEMLDYTKSMATGESVEILVNVMSEDGITRRLVGTWVK